MNSDKLNTFKKITFGYMFSGEVGSRLLNYGAFCLLVFLIRDFVIYLGVNALGPKGAPLLFLSTPLAFLEGSAHYIELIWWLFFLSGIYEYMRSLYEKVCLENLKFTHLTLADTDYF